LGKRQIEDVSGGTLAWIEKSSAMPGGRINRLKKSSARLIFSFPSPIFCSALPIFPSARPKKSSARPIFSFPLPRISFHSASRARGYITASSF